MRTHMEAYSRASGRIKLKCVSRDWLRVRLEGLEAALPA